MDATTRASVEDVVYRLDTAREGVRAGDYVRAAQVASEAAQVLMALDRRLLREWWEAQEPSPSHQP